MTDLPCLSSADGVNHVDRPFCFVAKSKNKLYVSCSARPATNSQRYNKSLVYLMWMAHQAIIKPSSCLSLNLFISLLLKRHRTISFVTCRMSCGILRLSWTGGHIRAFSLNIHDKVSLLDWDTALWIPFITCEKSQMVFLSLNKKNNFHRGKHDTAESTNYAINHSVF